MENSLPEQEVEMVPAEFGNLLKFCKHVQLHNMLHTRSLINTPIFLPRCLTYRINAKREKKSESSGIMVFSYMDSPEKLLRREFVKNFTCPFCSMPCGGQNGIERHLVSSHDVFYYWFQGTAVDVFLKPDAFEFGEQGNEKARNPNSIPFRFCLKNRQITQRRKIPRVIRLEPMEVGLGDSPRVTEDESSNMKDGNNMKQPNVDSMELDIGESPRVTGNELINVDDGNMKQPNVDSMEVDIDDSPHVPENEFSNVNDGNNMEQPNVDSMELALLVLARAAENELSNVNNGKISPEKISEVQTTNEPEIAESSRRKKVPLATRRRKLSAAERSEAKRVSRLQSRQFYHSQTAQPMSLAEVMADADSEDEPDDVDADLKERSWLNQLVGVSDEDKHFMLLWNRFQRKQRLIADEHVPWACEEFTKLHEKELNTSPSFFWAWKHFQIHLCKIGLITGKTMDKCTTIYENLKAEAAAAGPSTSRDPANGN